MGSTKENEVFYCGLDGISYSFQSNRTNTKVVVSVWVWIIMIQLKLFMYIYLTLCIVENRMLAYISELKVYLHEFKWLKDVYITFNVLLTGKVMYFPQIPLVC